MLMGEYWRILGNSHDKYKRYQIAREGFHDLVDWQFSKTKVKRNIEIIKCYMIS